MKYLIPAVEELRTGHDLMLKLRDLTSKDPSDGSGELVEGVINSINNALAVVVSRVPVPYNVVKKEMVGSEDQQEERMNCASLKRQRQYEDNYMGYSSARNPDVVKMWSKNPEDHDGYIWKKYGQKSIHGAKYQRSYFKCMQSEDQGCEAKKQVQLVKEDSSTFLVTYIGKHTCQRIIYSSQPLYNDAVNGKILCMISFNTTNTRTIKQEPLFSSEEKYDTQNHELKGLDCSFSFSKSFSRKRAKEEEVTTPETTGSVSSALTSTTTSDSGDDFDMSDEVKVLLANFWT